MEISRQEYWSGLPFPSAGDLPNPGIEPRSPALQADTLLSEPLTFSLHSYYVHSLAWKLVAGPMEFTGKRTSVPTIAPATNVVLCFPLFLFLKMYSFFSPSRGAAAKLRQSCLTLCDPIYGSPPGPTVPGILQARTLEWIAISFSNA